MHTPARILVVDDNPTNRVVLAGSLNKAGYEVQTAADGFKAIDAVMQHKPDLILLDMMMPKRDGLAVCAILKAQEETAAIPIIFVTALSNTDQILKGFEAGGCDYITKPFRSDEVLARVSTHLRLRQAEQELRLQNKQLEELTGELAALSRTDPLTKLLNRRVWEQIVEEEHERYRRYGCSYSIVMIDVDCFKAFNDSRGHQAGDKCLQNVAETIASACREGDKVGRYGGEEFVILLPQTQAEAAIKLAERVRKAVWNLGVSHPGGEAAGRVTISLGVATSASDLWDEVLKQADDALYVAKRAGRNMVYGIEQALESSAREAAMRESSNSGDSDRQPDSNPVTVLVVDDEKTNRVLCKACLQRAGYRVRQACDGLEAIASVKHDPPDTIIMDVMMPNMDGLECTKKLKTDPDTCSIPIIMTSALTHSDDVHAGLEAGADEYIHKPIRTKELTMRVRSVSRRYRENQDLLAGYEMRGEHTRILTRLVEFCRAVGASRQAGEVTEHTVSAVAEVARSRRVSIMFPDGDEQRLKIVKSMGMDEELASTVRVPIGEPIAGQVFASGKPVVSDRDTPAPVNRKTYDSRFFASVPLLCVPMGMPTDVIGVLNVTERIGGRPFEKYELEYIELIAKIAAAAVRDISQKEAGERASNATMVALAKLAEHRDSDTAKHLDRVTQYCLVLANHLRERDDFREHIDDAFLYDLGRAVPLHDIGKVAIPDEILLHPGKLTPDQMKVMRTHAEVGARTLETLVGNSPGIGFLVMAADVAYCHHEWYDGTGYPRSLKADAIPLSARISALADVYDALTTRRVYKDAVSHDKAVAVIVEGSGTQFDPAVVDAFIQREKDFASLSETMIDGPAGLIGIPPQAVADSI